MLENRPDGAINPQDVYNSLSPDNVDQFVSTLCEQNLSADDHLKQLTEHHDLAILYKGQMSNIYLSNSVILRLIMYND